MASLAGRPHAPGRCASRSVTESCAATRGMTVRAFTVAWDESRVEDLRVAVRRYRFPRVDAGPGWTHGCDPDFLKGLCDYWVDGFDARAAARELNRHPQLLVRIEDL